MTAAAPSDASDHEAILAASGEVEVVEDLEELQAAVEMQAGASSGQGVLNKGGAGGSIWVLADTLTLTNSALNAWGGYGESTHIRAGGDGGVGRIRVDCNVVDGFACTSSDGSTAMLV